MKRVSGWAFFLLSVITLSIPGIHAAAADVDLSKHIVKSAPLPSLNDLTAQADAIVYGWFDSADEELPTGQTVTDARLVNFVQTLHAERVFRGEAGNLYRVLSTGMEPMPDADNPLNREYPGPMVEGRYICFLQRIQGSETYAIIGGWQGVYPVYQGKTISLEGEGFPELNGLSVEQFAQRLTRN